MTTFEVKVGRLCELRMYEDFSAADMPGFRARMVEVFTNHSGKLYFVNDLRAPKKFGAEEERQLAAIMKSDNPRIGRSAFLVQRGSNLALQVLRLVGDTEHKGRRVFQSRPELEAWLGEQLTAEESARMKAFLDESR